MWKLPNDCSDFAPNGGTPADHTEKTGGIPYPRATNKQAGFRRGGTRDHRANLWMMEKAREHQRDLFMCSSTTRRPLIVSTMRDCG